MAFQRIFDFFSGEGLGTRQSSVESVGSIFPGRYVGQAGIQLAVNAANGNVCFRGHHHVLVDRGFSMGVGFVYNHQSETPWHNGVEKSLVQRDPDTMMLTEGDGHTQNLLRHQTELQQLKTSIIKLLRG